MFGPVAVTLYIAWWFINTVDNWVRPLRPGELLARHLSAVPRARLRRRDRARRADPARFHRRQYRRAHAGRDRRGDARPHAGGARHLQGHQADIRDACSSQSGTHFRRVGLVEFPIKGAWSIVFLSVRAARRRSPPCCRRTDDVGVSALHAQSDHRLLLSTCRPRTSSNCRSRRTRRPSS